VNSKIQFFIKTFWWADGVAQVVEHLPSQCEALRSNCGIPGTKRKEKVMMEVVKCLPV
jgi:hypothetical protein